MASTPGDDKHAEEAIERRVSHMSIEEPSSPASTSSDSDFGDDGDHEDDFRQNQLRPSLSHTSSMNQVGNVVPTLELMRTWTTRTSGTATDPAFEIDFAEGEQGNPQNWPLWYKAIILLIMSYATTAVVLFSTSYTSAIPGIQKSFGISNSEGILGVTTYLIGMAVGSVILAPLSEMYGRRPIYVAALGGFVIFVIPCAVAKNIETILIARFFGAFCAAAMISNAPGTVNDIVDEEHRALAFSIWSIGPMNGPVIGPVVGGFVYEYLGWRWTNWVVIIGAGVAWVTVSLVQETYGPAILRRRAKKRRNESGDERWFSRYDEKLEFFPL
jgi:multidrug resistance protein